MLVHTHSVVAAMTHSANYTHTFFSSLHSLSIALLKKKKNQVKFFGNGYLILSVSIGENILEARGKYPSSGEEKAFLKAFKSLNKHL